MRPKQRAENGTEFAGNIIDIRAVEDCIRATKKYTEGVLTARKQHPIQGGEFPSKVFYKYYEFYPDTEIGWDMPVGVALDLLWHEVPCIDVLFRYDYRINKASIVIKGGAATVKALSRAAPGFMDALNDALAKAVANKGVLPVEPLESVRLGSENEATE